MRTFNRIVKQVEGRKAKGPTRRGVHQLLHDVGVYLLELKTFHVKHLEVARGIGGDDALHEYEKELLAAGEQFEAAIKDALTRG